MLSRRQFLKTLALVFTFVKTSDRCLADTKCGITGPRSAADLNSHSETWHTPLLQFAYSDVKFEPGVPQEKQLDQALSVLMALDEDSLLRPFRQRAGQDAPGKDLGGWYDEFAGYDWEHNVEHGFAPGHCFGQWVSALCRAYAIKGDQKYKDKALRLVRLYEKTISPSFYKDFRFPAYTYDKLVCGLIDAHEFAGDGNALAILHKTTEAAEPYLPKKALDHDEMRALPHINESFCWDESYTLPENLFLAYQRGAGDRYRELAIRFLKDDTYFDPLAENKNVLPDHHAYSYMNALSSAMQAYITLGSKKHLQAAKNAFEMITSTQSFATGGWGPDEAFRKPGSGDLAKSLEDSHHSFETPCGSYAHFKLTRYLLRVTGDTKYGDSMERVMYNTVLGAKPLREDGFAFYYSDYNFNGQKGYRETSTWTCCAGSLPQVAADYRINTYFHDEDGIYVNLYIPSTVNWQKTAGNQIALTQKGNYPLDEDVKFHLSVDAPVEFTLAFRIPIWASRAKLTIKPAKDPDKSQGQEIECPAGQFAKASRLWSNGDSIILRLPMSFSLEQIDPGHPAIVALMRGPIVLFPLTNKRLSFTREQLLSAKRIAPDVWTAENTEGSWRFVPFTKITDEKYSTYVSLIS